MGKVAEICWGSCRNLLGKLQNFSALVAEFGRAPAESYLRRCGVLYAELRSSLICNAACIFAETAGF